MKRSLAAGLLGWVSLVAWAGSPAAVRKTVEATTLVTGTIVVAPDGHTQTYQLDHPEKLSPVIVGLVAKSLPRWRFSPFQVDGRAVPVKARMSLRLIASRLDAGHFNVRIGGASFGQRDPAKSISRWVTTQPSYPRDAVRARVAGTVYLLLKVGPDGHVEDVGAEQVNLQVVASGHMMDFWRKVLADAALRAARHWTFHPPTAGRSVHAPYWYARVPVRFSLHRFGQPLPKDQYGQWYGYVPGPRQLFPWEDLGPLTAASVDAVPAGGVYQLDRQGPQLQTPLSGT